jgi:hypothetical protein
MLSRDSILRGEKPESKGYSKRKRKQQRKTIEGVVERKRKRARGNEIEIR